MAGQGDGLLQPTKLLQTDDMMPSIALPGYQTYTFDLAGAWADQILYVVPDGIKAEIMDIGITVSKASTSANITDIVFSKVVAGTATALNSALAWNTADTAGTTKSALRGSVTYTSDADTAAERQLDAGSHVKVALTKGSAAAGILSLFVRLKFLSKDNGAI